MADLDHAALCWRAARWLRHHHGCQVVAVEPRSLRTREQPDTIGWRGTGWSVLVEVKTSRSDFKRDAEKRFRHPDSRVAGMGQERWYLTPPGLVQPGEVPAGWGLVEARGRVLRVVVPVPRSAWDPQRHQQEIPLLMSMLQTERRLGRRDETLPVVIPIAPRHAHWQPESGVAGGW